MGNGSRILQLLFNFLILPPVAHAVKLVSKSPCEVSVFLFRKEKMKCPKAEVDVDVPFSLLTTFSPL